MKVDGPNYPIPINLDCLMTISTILVASVYQYAHLSADHLEANHLFSPGFVQMCDKLPRP